MKELFITLSFDQLDDNAKERAREKAREWAVIDDWWEFVYEDAVHMAALLGIQINVRHKSKEPDIRFTGFWSQGDGASFVGHYNCAPDAVEKITAETDDKELLRIAEALTTIQVKCKLLYADRVQAVITCSGHYFHSGTMNAEVFLDETGDYAPTNAFVDIANDVQQLMRDFADWIYERLEEEYDYLTSDENVDSMLAEHEFDEDGDFV